MARTVIVTGGCGYIGSHVARAFKETGDTVHIIDNVYREHTVKGIDGHLINDFASKAALSMIIMLEPDIIVHCAGTSLVGPSMSNPAIYYDNNISKTIALLNVVKGMNKKPAIMFSSSASVYGEPKSIPVDESCAVAPISPYGNTKAMTERILHDYRVAYGINSICFRYFNAAGAEPFAYDLGQEPEATHIIARALEASINKKVFLINGSDFDTPDGTCVRDYVHVWDIALAHVKGAAMLDTDEGAYIFNLGTNKGISNKEIAEYVNNKYGLPGVIYGQIRPGDPAELVADAKRAMDWLDWEPMYSEMDLIIDSAYNWYTRNDI